MLLCTCGLLVGVADIAMGQDVHVQDVICIWEKACMVCTAGSPSPSAK